MSHRPVRQQYRDYRADSGRMAPPPQPAPAPHRAPRHASARTDYTLGHAGRHVRLGPMTFWIAVGTLVVMAGWSLATGTYFAFHDDVLTRLIARQKEQQFAYEDRIAELRTQVDRITGRQLLDQEQFEQKLDQIIKRQAILEQRASMLAGTEPATTGSVKHRTAPIAEPGRGERPSASPINATTPIPTVPSDREARLEASKRSSWARRLIGADKPTAAGLTGTLTRIQASLDRVEARQTTTLAALEARYDSKARRIRGVLADLGVNSGKAGPSSSATGGPFVPATLPRNAASFERQFYRLQQVRADADRLSRTLTAVPVRKPINGDIDLSSTFGVRPDPFLGRPAMHTGLDMRGTTGDPVRATADGTVTVAGWNGGYGNMVEISHGNGFATRYGHMSAIDVRVGQHVKIGQLVGRIGSTGRSTGPHLHYETRIDGEAVDPQRFLRAGVRLGGLL
jgi:murein DD-endopeptidase MepM/ murein hydrolase activator NlpD